MKREKSISLYKECIIDDIVLSDKSSDYKDGFIDALKWVLK